MHFFVILGFFCCNFPANFVSFLRPHSHCTFATKMQKYGLFFFLYSRTAWKIQCELTPRAEYD